MGELIKKCTNKSVKRFLKNLPDVGMGYWLTKYTNKGQMMSEYETTNLVAYLLALNQNKQDKH